MIEERVPSDGWKKGVWRHGCAKVTSERVVRPPTSPGVGSFRVQSILWDLAPILISQSSLHLLTYISVTASPTLLLSLFFLSPSLAEVEHIFNPVPSSAIQTDSQTKRWLAQPLAPTLVPRAHARTPSALRAETTSRCHHTTVVRTTRGCFPRVLHR